MIQEKKILSIDKIFDRAPNEAYLEEWTKIVAASPEKKKEETRETSFVLFRLDKEWFALSTLIFYEIGEERPINPLPQEKESDWLGLANQHGQLRLCFSMHHLLGLKERPFRQQKKMMMYRYPRLLAITDNHGIWAFPVDEVDGVYLFDLFQLTPIPLTIFNSKLNCLKGLLRWNEKKIYVIDELMIFKNLHESLK